MKGKILLLTAVIIASVLTSCNHHGRLTDEEIQHLIDGPNSLKGTITGTRLDGTPYSFPYDYHVTTNDASSYSESYIDSNSDSVLFVDQYFFFDNNGPAAMGTGWSPSGRFARISFFIKMNSMKIEAIDKNDKYHNYRAMLGMWQNSTPEGERFVYGTMYYYSYNNFAEGTDMVVSDLQYDKSSEILSGKILLDLPETSGVRVNSGNHNPTTISGDFKIFVPRESFELANG